MGEPSEHRVADMHAIETLCALQLAARRLGCTIRIHGASAELRELIDLAGLDDVLLEPPTAQRGLGDRGTGAP